MKGTLKKNVNKSDKKSQGSKSGTSSLNSSLDSGDISRLLEELDQDLIDKMWDPVIVKSNRNSIGQSPSILVDIEAICKNPDNELPSIKKTQINFRVPVPMKDSTDPTVIEIKKTISAYVTTYEKQARDINSILDFTRKKIVSIFNPLKAIKAELQNYAKEFQSSMNNLAIPIKNKNDLLNSIKPKKDKEKQFLKDKELIIKEINNYGQEAKTFHQKYSKLNAQNLQMVQNFVDSFQNLIGPAKECANIIKKGISEFESSSNKFGNVKNKKLMLDTLEDIKKKTRNMQTKFQEMKALYDNITEIKPGDQENLSKTISEMKEINKKLKEKSDSITQKIEEIRKKYDSPQIQAKKMEVVVPEKSKIKEEAVIGTLEIKKNKDECVQKIEKEKTFDTLPSVLNYMRLDILFIMDITNSMDEYLDQAKKEIEKMTQIIQKHCPTADIFLGFVGYRDFNDLDLGKTYVDVEFTQNYKNVTNSIKDVEADGGGDVPEDLAGAFEMALNKKWEGRSKFAILVTDAPCHGEKYHKLTGDFEDNFPEGDREGRDIEKQVAMFAQKEISLFCMKITELTDLMFDIFKKIYDNNKPKGSNCNFIIENKGKISDIVTKRAIQVYGSKAEFKIEDII